MRSIMAVSETERSDIKSMFAAGVSCSAIARKFCVPSGSVWTMTHKDNNRSNQAKYYAKNKKELIISSTARNEKRLVKTGMIQHTVRCCECGLTSYANKAFTTGRWFGDKCWVCSDCISCVTN